MSYLLSERHFRRYEDYLARIITSYPNPITFEVIPPISQADVLARNIRNAGNSLEQFCWEPKPGLDFPKFIQVWDEISISPTLVPGKVICGPTSTLRKLSTKEYGILPVQPSALEGAPMQAVPQIKLVDPEMPLIVAVLMFHHFKFLTEQSVITTKHDLDEVILITEQLNAMVLDIAISVIETNTDSKTYSIL